MEAKRVEEGQPIWEIWKKRRITIMASNNTTSLDETRSIYCQTASKTTVWRALKAKSTHQAGKNEEVSDFNTKNHKKAKMDFACGHMSWISEWTEDFKKPFLRKEGIWFDISQVNLDDPKKHGDSNFEVLQTWIDQIMSGSISLEDEDDDEPEPTPPPVPAKGKKNKKEL
uniref:Uncharacterized protein n=1 Tax=Heterorhabditis bacteriophora TaxID=37862 RepID=A0A1I7X9C3_HETBA